MAAFADGLRRVARAPMLVLGLYVAALAAALPAGSVAWSARPAPAAPASRAAPSGSGAPPPAAAARDDLFWIVAFNRGAAAIAGAIAPEAPGAAAVLPRGARGAVPRPPVAAAAALAAVGLILWAFATAGAIDRLARQRRLGTPGFCAAAGVHVWRFVRLALVAAAAAWLVAALAPPALPDAVGESLTDGGTAPAGAGARGAWIALAALLALVAAGIGVILDFARIRTVVEDRRSTIGALLAAWRFVRRHPAAVVGLWLLNALVFTAIAAATVTAFGLMLTGAASSPWPAVLLGQAALLARLVARLVWYAAGTAYFQSRLAHAAYVAGPPPAWPESPAAEAITGPPPGS